MTISTNGDIRTLTDAEITAVAGGVDGSGSSKGDGVLQQVEGVVLGGLASAAKAASNLVTTIVHAF